MADVLTKIQRSRNMALIRSKDTKPEILVRRMVHSLGFRYGLHQKKLAGTPDIVLTRHKKVIFINGCFWHMHKCKYGRVTPKTNVEFWINKRLANTLRDRMNLRNLRKKGWTPLVIWECQLKQRNKIRELISQFIKQQ
jgi:DNA mismatch endonuclease (patch repair protein)